MDLTTLLPQNHFNQLKIIHLNNMTSVTYKNLSTWSKIPLKRQASLHGLIRIKLLHKQNTNGKLSF